MQDYLLNDQEENQIVVIKPVPIEKVVDAAPEPPITEQDVQSTETPTAKSLLFDVLFGHSFF